MKALFIAVLLLLSAGTALAAASESADSFDNDIQGLNPGQELRYQKLTSELRCLVCQNEAIADSSAALANDMREQVRSQIISGQTDAQILKYLTDRYGDFVLYKPPFKPVTLLLWLGPLLLVVIGLTLVLVFVRRSRHQPKPAALNQEALKRLLDENP